jgi:nucleoside-diphosphate-sugar epimerase
MVNIKTVSLTGASGFVGKNLSDFLCSNNYFCQDLSREDLNPVRDDLLCSSDALIHLAGKAHDLMNVKGFEDYYVANTQLTKNIYDTFLKSDVNVFIFVSSIKAVSDSSKFELSEDYIPIPKTNYGKSKLLAEQYILSKEIPEGKRVYILRPSMIHGPGNKGNLNLLFKLISRGIPWPLGAFENKRSFCSIDNLIFIIKELIDREYIPSGVYNVADDEALSTNDVISILAESMNKTPKIWDISQNLIRSLAKMGDFLHLPLTTERLKKLTESYLVSNKKIKNVIGLDFPITAKDGLLKTFKSLDSKNLKK